MNSALLIILLFLLFSLYLGIRAKRGKDMNMEQFAVGGRGFGTLFIFLLIAGEVYTTFTFLGGSGWAYSKGAAAYYVPAYIFLAYVLSYWLAPKVWRYAKDHNIISQPDFFASKYNSRGLGIIVAIVGSMALVPYIVIQFKGLGIIVGEASYGAIPPLTASIIGAAVVTIYVMVSGIHGSAWTALIKDFMILAIVIFLGIYIPFHYFGGIQPMFENVQAVKPEMLTLSAEGLSPAWFISTVLLNALGFYLLPNSFVVVLSANGEKSIRKNAITLPLYTLLLLFVFFIGFAAVLKIPGLQGADGDLSLLRLAIQTFDPWMIGLIGAAGLLTALVPASVMLMAASVGLTKSFYKVLVPHATEKQQLNVSKLFILLISSAALVLTVTGGEALAMLNIMSYSLVTQLAPSLFFSLFNKNTVNKYGAGAGIIVSVLLVLYVTIKEIKISTFLPDVPHVINDISLGFIALIINVIVMLVVSFITRAMAVNSTSLENVENSSFLKREG
ncbi:sodium:solute symporter family protein [Fictibacillus fluitans]|uniref:Sodium:solute symporter family protein n=1 Tax=Fictibacillus fluitans TaxID=3058422 RepID=A0ABT8HQH7_9BACL|nr:sodium:solute symporter family protein [Fictibacillus sp. NE201]MDN4523000.1 sodium:solute symporter family protein [Fictibacillus sp. NE201]